MTLRFNFEVKTKTSRSFREGGKSLKKCEGDHTVEMFTCF